jgi:hypothetical protein
LRLDLFFAQRRKALVQRRGQIAAAEIVRIRLAGGAQRLQLLAPLLDQLVVFLFQVRPLASGSLR